MLSLLNIYTLSVLSDINCQLNILKSDYDRSQDLLRHLDLLLEAHKQLLLAITAPPEDHENQEVSIERPASDIALSPRTNGLEKELQRVQNRIAQLEAQQDARCFLSACAIPSVASSPIFSDSLGLLLDNPVISPADNQILNRSFGMMEKCWDNALTAMERVLERDLVSLEAYLDDPVYKELRDSVLKPLLVHYKHLSCALIEHFVSTYAQLRINFVTYVLDTRLNTQFFESQPEDQILHLIERTRLVMTVERREFMEIFSASQSQNLKVNLNRILETVGNLLYKRIEPICSKITVKSQISNFIHPLMASILKIDESDPFGLFLNLLAVRFFKPDISVIPADIKYITNNSDKKNISDTATPPGVLNV